VFNPQSNFEKRLCFALLAIFCLPALLNADDLLIVGKQVAVLKGHGSTVGRVAFNPSGTLLHSGDHHGQLKTWAIASSRGNIAFREIDDKKFSDRITAMSYDDSGKFFAVCGATRWGNGFGASVRVFTPYRKDPFKIDAKTAWSFRCIELDPRGNWIALGGPHKNLKVVSLIPKPNKNGKPIPNMFMKEIPGIPEAVKAMAVSPDGRMMVVGGDGGWLYRVGIRDNSIDIEKTVLDDPKPGTGRGIFGMAMLPKSNRVITHCPNHELSIYDYVSGRKITSWSPVESVPTSLDVHPSEPLVAVGYEDNKAAIINYNTREVLATLDGHSETVTDVKFSPNGKYLATGSIDQTVRIWQVAL